MKHPTGASEDKRQENPPEYYHSVCGDSDGLCRKRFLTIDSPQHSFAEQMQGEPYRTYLYVFFIPVYEYHIYVYNAILSFEPAALNHLHHLN